MGFCILVLLMVSIGGITRMTRSGLSIVEWRPISGIIPPITNSDWQTQFELYKSSPEFNQLNSHFTVEDYKNIFLWEYIHRLLGRLIFLFVILPGFVLWRKKIISGRLVLLFAALIALQGLIGWLMVKTGLNVRPHVSPYMLALHFFSALIVLVLAYYHLCKLRDPLKSISLTRLQTKLVHGFGVLLGLQIFYGCLTSGLKAGYGYNTYPLMNGRFFPDDGLFFSPLWINLFENTATVQWTHRWLGILVITVFFLIRNLFIKSPAWPQLRKSFLILLVIMFVQIILGILNIIYIVPLPLAALHQLGASILVLAYFDLLFRLKT